MTNTLKTVAVAIIALIATCALSACNLTMSGPSGPPKVAGSPSSPPDYNLPESQFTQADFNKLGSEWLDEYVGHYVVFDARYLNHHQGSLMYDRSGRPQSVTDVMSATLGAPSSNAYAPSPRMVTVHWAVSDRELGRPFLNLVSNAPVRIYAFVLPAQTPAQMKSRRDAYLQGFTTPVILLIKAEPLGTS